MKKDSIKYLSGLLTQNRKELYDKVLAQRSRYISVVLEDINQAQNASAVLRTCDCIGIQDVYIVENNNLFKIDREVALGASKWLTMHRYSKENSCAQTCISDLKRAGYRILATTPNSDGRAPEEIDLTLGKTAIVFGSEVRGISGEFLNAADEFIRIPMYGFTESFNISASAAIVLYQLNLNLRKSNINWQLEETEADTIKLEWLRKNLKSADLLEKEYLKSIHNKNESE